MPSSALESSAPYKSRMPVLAKALAIASFLIYAATIFALPQVRDSRFCCEQSSFAAAVSNIVYGSRIGSMYTGVFDIFIKHFTEPLPQALKEIRAELPVRPPGKLSPTTLDGNGVGYPLVATAAFRIFGFHWWAPIAVMLILMAASTAAFLHQLPALLVTLYFSGLTVMLFTELIMDPAWRWQIPIGGIRYFVLVGVLPLFHILLSLMKRQPARATAPLVIQGAILTVVAITRGSAITAFGAIAFLGLVVARRRPAVLRDLATVGAASAAVVIVVAFLVSPQWLMTGRYHTIVWTRVTQSLGMNPSLPIADLNKMFPCQKQLPAGIPPGIGDEGGQCIWRAYVIEHNIPEVMARDKAFSGEFETVMRKAFFRIAFRYPWETVQTFIYYKPMAIIQSMKYSLWVDFSHASQFSIVLLLASLGIALFTAATAIEVRRETAAVLISSLFTTTAYLAAHANQATSADLLLCVLIVPGLVLSAIALGIRAKMRRLD